MCQWWALSSLYNVQTIGSGRQQDSPKGSIVVIQALFCKFPHVHTTHDIQASHYVQPLLKTVYTAIQ